MSDAEVHDPDLPRLGRRKIFFELLLIAVIGMLLVSGIHAFVAQPFMTSGDSMVPTFLTDEYLVIDELTYYFQKPQRGDVVIFHYPLDPSSFFIKRLIGLPGDTITITDGVVAVRPQGSSTAQILGEPYVAPENRKKETSTITLGDDEYFVLGDNRNTSFDSRVWGPVPGRYIVGRAAARLFPLQKFTLMPGAYNFSLNNGATGTLSTVK